MDLALHAQRVAVSLLVPQSNQSFSQKLLVQDHGRIHLSEFTKGEVGCPTFLQFELSWRGKTCEFAPLAVN